MNVYKNGDWNFDFKKMLAYKNNRVFTIKGAVKIDYVDGFIMGKRLKHDWVVFSRALNDELVEAYINYRFEQDILLP